jgi:hypothetical protein
MDETAFSLGHERGNNHEGFDSLHPLQSLVLFSILEIPSGFPTRVG